MIAAADEAIVRHGTFAEKHYVERALRSRGEQGLPAAIEDDETLEKIALLMSVADVRSPATAIDGVVSAADRRTSIRAVGGPAPWSKVHDDVAVVEAGPAQAPTRPGPAVSSPNKGLLETCSACPKPSRSARARAVDGAR